MDAMRSVNGALAGALAAAVWAAQQPLDKRAFESDYDDVELLGKLVTRGDDWQLYGLAIHAANGAAFGAVYAQLKPFIPGPPMVRGVLAGLTEHFALWPLGRLSDRFHPARKDLTPLAGNGRVMLQSIWRHFLFGALLGLLEDQLNKRRTRQLELVDVSSNGHGDIEAAMREAATETG
jgi:hypothetical protein